MTPGDTPNKTPVVEPMVAAAPLQIHVPPVVASVRVIVLPVQTPDGPLIATGRSFTVTVVVVIQPVGRI